MFPPCLDSCLGTKFGLTILLPLYDNLLSPFRNHHPWGVPGGPELWSSTLGISEVCSGESGTVLV